MPTLNIFELMQRFRKSVNTFEDIGFLPAQFTGWKWQNFKCCRCGKFSSCHYKCKIPAHLKPFTRRPTLSIFELRRRFRKSVKYLWRYRIFSRSANRLKVAKFQMLSLRKIFNFRLKKLNTCAPETFHPKAHPQNLRAEEKNLENRLNTFGDVGFLLAEWTGWKWQNFKCCRCAKFSPFHCNSKITAHVKLFTRMPTLNIFELRGRFRKSVEYFRSYRIFAGTVNRLKVAKFQMLSMRKVFTLPLQK